MSHAQTAFFAQVSTAQHFLEGEALLNEPGEWLFRKSLPKGELGMQLLTIEGGIGDHFMLKSILPEVAAAHPGDRLVVAASRPEVFADDDVEVIPFSQARYILGREDLTDRNPYTWSVDNKHQGQFIDVFRLQYVHGNMGTITIQTGE